MNAPLPTRKPGDSVSGKWKLERVLRMSATATTYAATHRNGAPVALKILHKHLAADPDAAERFRREAYAANVVPHPGVVKIVDDDTTEDGCAVLVMDLVEGEPLEDLRRAWGGRLPLDVAVDFVGQLLDVVAIAHDLGIVHRDLQPESVVIAPGGRVRLFDFGIAKLKSQPGAEDELTQNGINLGAPPFMAPEQALGRREHVDAQTDIFSAGATLFLLLSGQGLHDVVAAPTPLAQIIAASSHRARSLRSVVGKDLVPDAVVDVIDRALAFKKAERWLDARAFATALREACAGTLRAEVHPADDADDPTWTTGPKLEPEILANLKAAQGIASSRPPPTNEPLFPPSDEATLPVPDNVVIAARLAGMAIPGTAPESATEVRARAQARADAEAEAAIERSIADASRAPSSRRVVRRVTPAPARIAPVPAERPPPVAEPLPANDEPQTSVAKYPPRRGPEVNPDEATVIVTGTGPPPALAPMPQPAAMHPPAPLPSAPYAVAGPSPQYLGARGAASAPYGQGPGGAPYSPGAVPRAQGGGAAPGYAAPPTPSEVPIAPASASSSQQIAAHAPSETTLGDSSRRRRDDATLMLMPKPDPPRPPQGRGGLVAVLVIALIAIVLLGANLLAMRGWHP